MPQPRVYIETTIPSSYYNVRVEPENVARSNWTRRWWDTRRHEYELFASEAVLEEAGEGDYPRMSEVVALVAALPLLPVVPQVLDIVQAYIERHLMPKDPAGDALHLALASYYRCDFLLTWNCQHLANANKFRHIQKVNAKLGFPFPLPVTPLELLAEEAQP